MAISPDNRYLLYMRKQGDATGDVWVLPLNGDRKPFALVSSPYPKDAPRFSPDGHWVAYSSRESARAEIYVVPFPGSNGRWQVSTNTGTQPIWGADGKELFFLNEDGTALMSSTVSLNPVPQFGAPRVLFVGRMVWSPGWCYDVVSNGGKFAVMYQGEERRDTPLTLVQNWTAMLKRGFGKPKES